jgi:hypothetical protein
MLTLAHRVFYRYSEHSVVALTAGRVRCFWSPSGGPFFWANEKVSFHTDVIRIEEFRHSIGD